MKKRNYKVERIKIEESKKISSGNYYSILLIDSGRCVFSADGERYCCGLDDIILIYPGCSVTIEREKITMPLKMFRIRYSEELLRTLSDEETDLYKAFNVGKFTCTGIDGDNNMIVLCKNMVKRLLLCQHEQEYGGGIFENGLLSMFIILILRMCKAAEFKQRPPAKNAFVLDALCCYISEHITEEITLERLEKEFYVSRHHIIREFKKLTGYSVHRFIVKRKLALCQEHIANGVPLSDVYRLVGFGGYGHFLRAFKKEFGITPSEYCKIQKEKS